MLQLAGMEEANGDGANGSSLTPPRATSGTVAEAINASHTHVAKVVSRLVEIGVLISTRGRTGGIHLADGALDFPLGTLIWQLESTSDRIAKADKPTMLGAIPDQWPFGDDDRLFVILNKAEQRLYGELNNHAIRDIIPNLYSPESAAQSDATEKSFPSHGQQAAFPSDPEPLRPQEIRHIH